MTCRELTALLTDFLEGRMPLGERVRLRLHLLGCRHCRAYLRQMRQTLLLLGSLPDEPPPPEVRDSLRRHFARRKP